MARRRFGSFEANHASSKISTTTLLVSEFCRDEISLIGLSPGGVTSRRYGRLRSFGSNVFRAIIGSCLYA
jgi:hypothetical protein